MSKRKRALLVVSVLLVCVAADQYTKLLAVELLKGRPAEQFLGGVFRLEYAENTGAFLSLGSSLPPPIRFLLLSLLVALLVTGIIYYLFTRAESNLRSIWALSLLAGGGMSNLIDRFTRHNGHVVDFMNLGIGSLRTGIFNIADMAITLSVVILLLQSLKPGARSKGGIKSKS